MGTIIDLTKDYNCCSEVCGYYHRSDQTKDYTVVVRKFVGTIIDLTKDYNCCSEVCRFY